MIRGGADFPNHGPRAPAARRRPVYGSFLAGADCPAALAGLSCRRILPGAK